MIMVEMRCFSDGDPLSSKCYNNRGGIPSLWAQPNSQSITGCFKELLNNAKQSGWTISSDGSYTVCPHCSK